MFQYALIFEKRNFFVNCSYKLKKSVNNFLLYKMNVNEAKKKILPNNFFLNNYLYK
jgi:hypothetical protein